MANDVADYTLHLADNSLIMGHRLSEWTGHGPMLEQDIAISNIALDLIGQSRNFYQYAAQLINTGNKLNDEATEDSLAYLRDAHEFKNLLITEISNGDWAKTILKLFFFSTWQYYFYQKLMLSSNLQLAAIGEKSLKEVTYHLRWSSEWVIRLGDGTEESNKRMKSALDQLWPFTAEMFEPSGYEKACEETGVGVDVSKIKSDWQKKVSEVLEHATLSYPENAELLMRTGGKTGTHSVELDFILGEMQSLQRTYPGCEW